MFWNFKNVDEESTELRIEGEIVSDDDIWLYDFFGITATSPNAFKEELAQNKGKNITVWIDSYGGDVFAAAGIYNALKLHDGSVTVKIDGKALSAASVIAMAGTKIEMSPVSMMMIHNPLTMAQGDHRELKKVADILEEVKQTIINAYEIKTKKSRNKISQMMDDETWMSAKTAQKEGFADGMMFTEETVNNVYSGQVITNSMREFFENHELNTHRGATEPVVDIKLTEQKQKFNKIKEKLGGNN